ncbi:MAG TPA: sulfur carrier protein ThiS [Chthoniobacterales bacterium]
MIPLELNGEPCDVPENLTISDLLAHLGLTGQPLLVEQNGIALFKNEWAEKPVNAGDKIELIRVVAGG